MYNNEQWQGHGQVETTDIFRELAEITPELPIGKIVQGTKSAVIRLARAVRVRVINEQAASTESAVGSQSVQY